MVYDLQEPFRWIIDTTILSCVENHTFSKSDFFLTDNYVLRLWPSSIKKLLQEVRLSFNSRIEYKARNYCWDTIVQLKSRELARYILGKLDQLDLADPSPAFLKQDDRELRQRILGLTSSEARRLGIGKSTLWNLQGRARSRKPLKTCRRVMNRIDIG